LFVCLFQRGYFALGTVSHGADFAAAFCLAGVPGGGHQIKQAICNSSAAQQKLKWVP
jgi:hypothetical protein